MISVLIPLYQDDISTLLSSLLEAIIKLDMPGEIIVSDVSEVPATTSISDLLDSDRIKYYHHSKLKSRAENRNFLADKAQFDYLIFLDSDAILPNPEFLSNFVESLQSTTVICGGTLYQKEKPSDYNRVLRWKYGTEREIRTSTQRTEAPYNSFSSFNFCVPAKVFHEIRFNETVDQYGHEDTFFGFQLKENIIPIIHIDNPLIHNGLESADIFIKKTETGINTLVRMAERGAFSSEFLNSIQLWKTFIRLKKSRLLPLIKVLLPLIQKICLISLKSNNPSIRMFDVYKLMYLVKIQG